MVVRIVVLNNSLPQDGKGVMLCEFEDVLEHCSILADIIANS